MILTVGLGQGAQDEVKSQISALGSNLLIVSPGSTTSSSGVRGGFGSASTLTLEDTAAIGDTDAAPDVRRVAPTTSTSTALTAGETNWTTTMLGTTVSWTDVRTRDLDAGRFFTEQEVAEAAPVVVLGPDTASELYGGRSPVGRTVSADGTQLTVIGVLTASGSTASGSTEDDEAVMPISTAQQLTGSTSSAVSTLYVEATSADTLSAAYQEIDALL